MPKYTMNPITGKLDMMDVTDLASPGEIGGTTPGIVNATAVNVNSESVAVQPEVTTKALSQAVHMTEATSGSTGIQVANNDNLNMGTGDFTLVWRGSLPDWTPGSVSQCLFFRSNTGSIRMYLFISTQGNLNIYLNTYVAFSSTESVGFTDGKTNQIVSVVERDGVTGTVTFYANGIQLGSQVALTADQLVDLGSGSSLYVSGKSDVRNHSTTQSAYIFNRALSADEVSDLYRNGISFADKWGSQTPVLSESVLNGGFESAGTGGVDVFANWAESTAGTSTVNDETVDTYSGSHTCRFDVDNSNSLVSITTQSSLLIPGKRYNISYYAKSSDITSSPYLSVLEGASVGTVYSNQALTESYELYSVEFEATGQIIQFKRGSNCANTSIYIDNITITQLGATLALEPPGIQPVPGQWLDSSTNKLNAVYPTAGATITQRKDDFTIKHTCTWAGTSEDIYISGFNQNILPPNAYIESIVGVVSGTTIEDITIGDGSDTDHWVESTSSLSTGTTSFAIANHISDGTNEKIIVSPNANFTGSIEFTIKGYIL